MTLREVIMKKLLVLILCAMMLGGCAATQAERLAEMKAAGDAMYLSKEDAEEMMLQLLASDRVLDAQHQDLFGKVLWAYRNHTGLMLLLRQAIVDNGGEDPFKDIKDAPPLKTKKVAPAPEEVPEEEGEF